MKISNTPLSGLLVVYTDTIEDMRGSFSRWFCDIQLASILGGRHIRQINASRTTLVGTVRGLHYQIGSNAEMKVIRCIQGRVWDVAVDLRDGSSTYLRWHAVELSASNGRMLVVPEGFAHGFQSLETESQLLYLHTSPHAPDGEAGIRFDDPLIDITWPLPPAMLSDRDKTLPLAQPAGKEGQR